MSLGGSLTWAAQHGVSDDLIGVATDPAPKRFGGLMAIDNVWYALDLASNPKLIGYSRGPDNPPDGNLHDWPAPEDNPRVYTFHWFRQNGQQQADTRVTLSTVLGPGGGWQHFKTYDGTDKVWLITDLTRLSTAAAARGLPALSNFIDSTDLIPKLPVQG